MSGCDVCPIRKSFSHSMHVYGFNYCYGSTINILIIFMNIVISNHN